MRTNNIDITSEKAASESIETSLSDAQLIAAVRRDPPCQESLDILVARYWSSLFARCQILTMNRDQAQDLAQSAWCRLLQNRHLLAVDGNFLGYLTTIATNLFRDSYRASRRAGPLAENNLVPLDYSISGHDGETVSLESVLPDLRSIRADEQMLLAMDIDGALRKLPPLFRDVLLLRFIEGRSCAEIGRFHNRTEQTVSGWIREALRQMKSLLEEPDLVPAHLDNQDCVSRRSINRKGITPLEHSCAHELTSSAST